MNFKAFFDDSKAVSPVIGVILMVAITVILAAVIGTFVLGLGDQVQTTAPSVNFIASQSDTSVSTGEDVTMAEFEVTGGQTVDADTLSISHNLNGTDRGSVSNSSNDLDPHTVEGLSGEISAGDTITLTVQAGSSAGTIDLEGEEVSIVWASEGQSQSLSTVELEDVEVTS